MTFSLSTLRRGRGRVARLATAATLLLSTFAFTACGEESPAGTTVSGVTSIPAGQGGSMATEVSTQVEVKIVDMSFEPAEVTIPVGGSVRWLNVDDISHTVVADNGDFNSGLIARSAIFVHSFTKPGTYAYHSSFRPSEMAGVVIVE